MRKVEKREKIENIGKDFTHFTNVGHFHNWQVWGWGVEFFDRPVYYL